MRYFFAIASLVLAGVLLVLGIGQRTFLAGPKVIEHSLEFVGQENSYLVVPAEMFDRVQGSPAVVIAGQEPFMAIAHSRDVDAWVRTFDHDVVSFDEDSAEFVVNKKVAIFDTENISAPLPESDEIAAEDATDEAKNTQLLDPRGSDLWLVENEADTSLKVSLGLLANQSLLIATTLEEPVAEEADAEEVETEESETEGAEADVSFVTPKSVTLSWAQPRQTPLAGPFLAGAGLFAALGVILYLLAIDHNRKGIGPRRGRKGPLQGLRNKKFKQSENNKSAAQGAQGRGTRMGFALALSAVSVVVLTSCSPSYWPQFEDPQPTTTTTTTTIELPEEKQAVVPVTDVQIDTILKRVTAATDEGDTELTVDAITERLASSALAQRSANYTILAAEPGWRKLPVITDQRLSYDLVQSTEKWPRTLFLTVESKHDTVEPEETTDEPVEETSPDETVVPEAELADAEVEEATPTLALLLTQASPHDNFELTRVIELRGGIEMPEAAALSEGTALLADDIQTLQLTPREVAESLADAMKNGEESEQYDFFQFENELLIEKMGASWARDQCVDGLTCSVDVVLSEEPVVSLSTGQSGALVIATLLDKHTMKVKEDRNVVKLSKVEKALGLEGSYVSVTREWQHQVLLYVPGEDSNKKITVLGSSSELVKATGKKA